jgi:hypothetical protein
MATLSTTAKERFFLDLRRDDCKIIERRGSAPADLKKAFGKLNRILAKMPLTPAGQRLVVLDRGDLIIKQAVKPDPQKMKNALAWMQRNAAKNAHRNLKETGSELLRKIRDGKIKA